MRWIARTREDALRGIRDVVGYVVADMVQHREPLPRPKGGE